MRKRRRKSRMTTPQIPLPHQLAAKSISGGTVARTLQQDAYSSNASRTGSFRTPGAHGGVTTASSSSKSLMTLLEPAVSTRSLSTPNGQTSTDCEAKRSASCTIYLKKIYHYYIQSVILLSYLLQTNSDLAILKFIYHSYESFILLVLQDFVSR